MKRLIFTAVVLCSGCITAGDFSANSLMTDIEFALPGSRVGRLGPGAVQADWRDEDRRWLHVVAIETQRSGIVLKAALANDRFRGRMETLDSLSGRKGALAAISVGYPDKRGLVTGGLTVLDRAVQLAPNPPKRPSIVIGRDYAFAIGNFHPDLNPDIDYDEALTGLWSVGSGHPVAPVGERPWTMICRASKRDAMLWIFAPDGGPAESVASKLKCGDAFIGSVGELAGMVVKGKNVATERGLRRSVGQVGSALLLLQSKS